MSQQPVCLVTVLLYDTPASFLLLFYIIYSLWSISFISLLITDELLEDDEREENNRAGKFIQSPSNRPKITACQSPLRKALSPINSNITTMPIVEVSSKDNVLSTTPKTPFIVTREKSQDVDTPLDKFNIRSSNMKVLQSYISPTQCADWFISNFLTPEFCFICSELSYSGVYRFSQYCNKVFPIQYHNLNIEMIS